MKMILNKKIYSILLFAFLLFAFGVCFLPGSVLASSVYINSNHSEFFVGDTVMFSVRIDPEGKNINSVDGEVLLDHLADAVSLTDINTSGSKFSLWPSKPMPSENNTSISFAGGSPGGLTLEDTTIFNIVLKLQKTGQVTLSPTNIGVYLNDGKGTKDKVNVKNFIVNVLPQKQDAEATDEWNDLISNDKTRPEPFEIYPGQEDSVFDGKKFLSFSTTDEQSDIAYYEVIENGLSPVRSNGTYVLREQNLPVKVTVIAYDSAGNTRKSVYNSAPSKIPYTAIVVLIIFMILTVFVFKKIRKIKNGFAKK